MEQKFNEPINGNEATLPYIWGLWNHFYFSLRQTSILIQVVNCTKRQSKREQGKNSIKQKMHNKWKKYSVQSENAATSNIFITFFVNYIS